METIQISDPVTPTSPTLSAVQSMAGKDSVLNKPGYNSLDSRTINLELLREQLKQAKIPLTKRGSITELPQNAEDCQFVAGTRRCSLPLCEDACTQSHQHHRTHAKPLAADASLVYSRPSISLPLGGAPGSNPMSAYASPIESPAVSQPVSQTNSPQAQYRRASAFGFNIGAHRGSVASTASGYATPLDALSAPPSPMSADEANNLISAPQSPRAIAQASFQPDFTKPIAEERDTSPSSAETNGLLAALDQPKTQPASAVPAAAAAPEMPAALPIAAVPVAAAPAEPEQRRGMFWRLKKRLINLSDYLPGRGARLAQKEKDAAVRQDLAAPPREDWPDQEHPAWDPRSPQPPSPVDPDTLRDTNIVRVNHNTSDPSQPEVEYELKH